MLRVVQATWPAPLSPPVPCRWGFDFSAEMFRLARQQNPSIEFQEGDAHALAFADRNFDIVTINFGLLHLADPERVWLKVIEFCATEAGPIQCVGSPHDQSGSKNCR
jgi:SAM-dependent methyltransferase